VFVHYLALASRSFRRHVALTTLMVIAIAFGIGASMTTLTVLHVLSADPIPGRSQDLYYVQLEPRPAQGATPGGEPPQQMTRTDAEALLRAARGDRQAMMTGGRAAIMPRRQGLSSFFVEARTTSADFFAMFGVPFLVGGPWNAEDDAGAARVVVLARALAEKVFGTSDVVGRTIQVGQTEMRIAGVIDHWRPAPRFYDLNADSYGEGEQLFTPFSTGRALKLRHRGQMSCWNGDARDPEAAGAPCAWIQFWVQLDSETKAAAYREFLVRYSEEQRRAGRFDQPPSIRLRSVGEWLDFKEVVPHDVRLQTRIALAFLLVCLINTVGLLLTKFLRRSAELGIRRALGASKRSIFVQLMTEAGVVGVTGGVIGLGLAECGVWAVRHQPTAYAELAQLDLPMLAGTFGLAIATSFLAGLLPAWRGCQLPPVIQLKSS
jgi:putative ABC transport system permease protein